MQSSHKRKRRSRNHNVGDYLLRGHNRNADAAPMDHSPLVARPMESFAGLSRDSPVTAPSERLRTLDFKDSPITATKLNTSAGDFRDTAVVRSTKRSATDAFEKPLHHLIVGIDFGYGFTKVAFGLYADGQDPESIQPKDIQDFEGWPGAPMIAEYSSQVQSQSFYQPSNDGRTAIISHGWLAADQATRIDYHRYGLVKFFKPQERYPENQLSWSNIPADGPEKPHSHPPAYARTLKYLKNQPGWIETEEDVDTNFLTWVFETLKACEKGPFKSGYVTHESTITIVFGCPVKYNHRARETLRRIGAKAASTAEVGHRIPATYGKVEDAVKEHYDVESTYEYDITNVYLVTEPEAALFYFLAKGLSQQMREELNGKIIVLMDFGAGTSDGAAYRLGRVSENDFNCTRVSQSIGASCGVQGLSDNLAGLVLEKLERLRDTIESNDLGRSLEQVIAEQVITHFEQTDKKTTRWDTLRSENLRCGMKFGRIPKLLRNEHSEFGCENDFEITITGEETFSRVFEPWLKANAALLREVVSKLCTDTGVSHIATIGGGANQPALIPYLQETVLDPINKQTGGPSSTKLKLMLHDLMRYNSNFVARGLVLTGGKRESAPPKRALTNICILEAISCEEHDTTYQELKRHGAEMKEDLEDDRPKKKQRKAKLFRATAMPKWFILQGEKISRDAQLKSIDTNYLFWDDEPEWWLEGTVVAKPGDARVEYQITHEMNKDHRIVGKVFKDVRPLVFPLVKGKRVTRTSSGREGVSILYHVHTTMQPKMRGPDLVLSWTWRDDRRDPPLKLAECVINMAASLEIEEVDIQVGTIAEHREMGD